MSLEKALAEKQGGTRKRREFKETKQQILLFRWRAEMVGAMPDLRWLHSSGNGYNLGSARAGKIANDSGRTKGIWDVFLPVPSYYNLDGVNGLYIEMKEPGERLTPEQAEFRDDLQHCFEFVVCYSADQAKAAILDYLERAK